jgi:hypothetical protein
MIKRFLAAGPALAFTVSIASAQEPPGFDPGASARQALERAGAAEFFEIVPDSTFATVQHRGSGLQCAWGPNDAVEITVFPSTTGIARGEDVGCAHTTPFGVHSLYATRHPTAVTGKAALDSAVMSIKTRSPRAKAARPAPATGIAAFMASRMPPSQSAQFVIDEGGRRHMTRVTVAQIDGWTFKSRYSGPIGLDSRADSVWLGALRNPLKSRRLPPYDKGPLATAP